MWEAPKEGYMTIEEYNRLNAVFETKAQQQLHEESKFMRENADELAAKYRREQLRAKRAEAFAEEAAEKEIERESYVECEEEDDEPGTSARPFGKWQTVIRKCVCSNILKWQIFSNNLFLLLLF